MEWRQQTSVGCEDAFSEAQRWIQEVTGKSFGCNDFRAALENGVLLCDLINRLKPGIIKKVNRLSTPIAGLDNVSVFLKACGKLGLNVSQLFHPGDLQDLSTRATFRRDESSRRLKNVLITIYWLGRKAHLNTFFNGPQLNLQAFEGLLGLALSKPYKTYNCVDSMDPRALCPNSEACGSDAEAEQVFKMENTQPTIQQKKGAIPTPLLRQKHGGEEKGRGCHGSLASVEDAPLSLQPLLTACPPGRDFDEELFLRATCEEDSDEDYTDPDPVLDDLYFRRVQQSLHQTSINPDSDRFLPGYWTPEEESRVRTIYLGSQRRPWYRKMQGLRSKSLSDIPMVYPLRKVPDGSTIYDLDQDTDMAREWNKENKRKCSIAGNDSEAQWHDDLTKWKNRRRSTKSDLRRKSQDREHVINQMVNGAVVKFEKNEAQSRQLRDHQSPQRHNPAPHPYSSSPSKSLSSDLRPHTRPLLARSYATDLPFSSTGPLNPHNSALTQGSSVGSMPASDGNILTEQTPLALHGAGATTPSVDCPFSSQTEEQGSSASLQLTSELAQPENVPSNHVPTVSTTKRDVTTKLIYSMDSLCHKDPFCIDPKVPTLCPDAIHQVGVDLPHQKRMSQEEIQKTCGGPAVEQGRDQQAAGVYKYLPRAGSWSSSASLPRGYRRSEGASSLSAAITARPFGAKPSRMSSVPSLNNVDSNQGLPLKSEKEESLSPTTKSLLKRQTATAHLKCQQQTSMKLEKANQAKQKEAEQAEEVKGAPVSSQTGSHRQPYSQTQPLPRPYSSLQTQHNKSVTIPPNVDHSDMRVSLTLKPNSTPDFGFQTHWDSRGAIVKFIQPGSPAQLCQLSVDDEIVAVNGVAVALMNYNQWKDKMSSSLQAGCLTMDIRRYGNKDWSTSEESHHSRPGHSKMTLNLTAAAPVLIGCPGRHANSATSTQTTVRNVSDRQSDNVLQGRVMHGEPADNHRTARSKGGSESAISDLQVPSLSPSSSSWSWDREEERRRQEKWQEEQERLLQEQYQRDQERLESEFQRAQQDAKEEHCTKSENTSEMTNGGEGRASSQLYVTGLTIQSRGEQSSDHIELKEAGSKPQSHAQGVQHDKISKQAWAQDSCGFALSPAHRAKSLSTPALAGPHKPTRGDERKRQSVSNAERDRQQILEEMKKRTQLLTDNSWIRQRSSSFYKEPIYVGIPMKRYESLDELDTVRQSPLSTSTFSSPRPHSAAAGYCAPTRNSSSRYSTGAIVSQRNALDSHRESVRAATDNSQDLRLESRCELRATSPTVSPAGFNSSLLVPLLCEPHAVLQITEETDLNSVRPSSGNTRHMP